MPRDGRPVDPTTRARVVELFAEGKGRNAIAREVRLSGATITKIASEEGHEFDRSQSELAVRLRTVDLAKMRVDLAHASLLKAWDVLEQLEAPAVIHQFEAGHQLTTHEGDKEVATWVPGDWRELVIDAPTFSDQRNLATMFGIFISKARELTNSNEAAGSAEAVSELDQLQMSLTAVRGAIAGMKDADPTVEPTHVTRESMLAEFDDASAELDAEIDTDPSV